MIYPTIDPVTLSLGPLQIHWYGLVYLFGFAGAWWLGRVRTSRDGWTVEQVEELLFYGAIVGWCVGCWYFFGWFDSCRDEKLWW